MTDFSAKSLLILLLNAIPYTAIGDEPAIQADIFNTLYEAYAQCDDEFDQSRSEFITDKLEHSSGEISIAMIRDILKHNVQIANQSIFQKAKERELYLSEILESNGESSDASVDLADEDKDPHAEIRKIDDFLKLKMRYVEVHECVLDVL